MFEKIKCKSIVLSSIIFVLCFAYNASAADITANAEIVGNISVTPVAALDFGQFSSGISAGTVTFSTSGAISSSTLDIVLLGGEINGIANLDTTGAGAGTPVTVTVTGTTLTGAGLMDLHPTCEGPGGLGEGLPDAGCNIIATGGASDSLILGGVLDVAAAQPVGTYSGVIVVTAEF